MVAEPLHVQTTDFGFNQKTGLPKKIRSNGNLKGVPLAKRIKDGVIVSTKGCWEWQGQRNRGYGILSVQGRPTQVHRVSYSIFVGPIEPGLTIDHLCRNPCCSNPEHLESVTIGENIRRATRLITHCPKGHAYDSKNTAVHNGKRACRACRHEWNRSDVGRMYFREYARKRRAALALAS